MALASDAVTAAQLAQAIDDYLVQHPSAAILEDGRLLFDLRNARYAVSEAHGRCLLELWSDERNLVRTVVEIRERAGSLRLMTRRMGAPKPQALEVVPSSDRRTPTARDAARRNYQKLLGRVLASAFLGSKVDALRSAMDLEHSFGPAYVRGHLLRGASAEAVIGVGSEESAATIDGILTLGILWLDYCREHADARRHFGGLKVIVPVGAWRTSAERMAWLNHAAANFQLFTLDERSEELTQIDFRDTGNLESRLVHAFSAPAALERCHEGVARLMSLVPPDARASVEVRAHSPSEVGLLLHGLEFARVRHGFGAHSFAPQNELTFGAGANETPLTGDNDPLARELFARLFASRHPGGLKTDPLFRLQPERWLESRLRAGLAELLPSLRGDLLYSQVPALTSGDRGLLDLLTLDRTGRLAVIEIKADEDLHLPLQALDYWIRVRALNADLQAPAGSDRPLSAFSRQGYFPATELSPLPPRLLLAAPALRIHPANQTVLRYFAPEIEWELIALSEHWRSELRIVHRKRAT
ncbi:MAG TPA: hypothetical protein VE291_13210 [Terracidiphilus sp.]|jgi:hypothetical protein|nr:hypothetical protein [Terracidiphilus sp.]